MENVQQGDVASMLGSFAEGSEMVLEVACLPSAQQQEGIDYYASDIHGEYQALIHMFKDLLSDQDAAVLEDLLREGRTQDCMDALVPLLAQLPEHRLHFVGDIYDRGPNPDLITETLMHHPNIDIQWGNHDMVWMGAALGQPGCLTNIVRICARYGNLDILSDAYGIDLAPLESFAAKAYAQDPCAGFALKSSAGLSPDQLEITTKIQKAMSVLQFKVEAALIAEYPSFGLDDRNLLHLINYEKGTVVVDGAEYALTDTVFPTVNPEDPYALTPDEAEVLDYLVGAFQGSQKLQRHMHFFFEAGSLCKVVNGNLVLHACVPLNADGTLMEVDVLGKKCKGRELYETMQEYVYQAFSETDPAKKKIAMDIMWYLWLGPGSPLFAKSKMATFELYLIAEKPARKEEKNAFYKLFDSPETYNAIFEDFGLDASRAHVICGHVPVKMKDGESPVKAQGKVVCIDGGFSAAYQKTTGVAGLTLVEQNGRMKLRAHKSLV